MSEYNLQTLAQFPFLTQGSDYIKQLKLSIDKILDSIAYRSAWARGKQRLEEAMDFGEIRDPGLASEAEYINELLSYVIARIIVSCIKDPYLVKRYALAEAVSAYHELQNQNNKFVTEVATQFNLIPIDVKDNEYNLQLSDYLLYSTVIRAPEWKLVNRDVQNGQVIITKRELSRLIQEAIRAKIQAELPINVDPEISAKIMPQIKNIINLVKTKKSKFETKDLGKVSITRFPPCIKQLLGMTQASENVPHIGRFTLASFLHHIGLTSDDILKLFSTSPDFDVEKARYQVEHITGKSSGTEYTPPGCDTMKSNSICYNPDNLCQKDWMIHPLTYYRIKGKKKGKPSDSKKGKIDNENKNKS